MNKVKKEFSIRDLENLSGIKAHTIRIWEKRYNLLAPERTSTNIRTYSVDSLQRLLNITLLYNAGNKISKIAKLPQKEVQQMVRELAESKNKNNHAIANLKLAMIKFDEVAFHTTYTQLADKLSFREIWHEILLPFLDEIGLLWQTDLICPSQEHFISHLIKELIFTNTKSVKDQVKENNEKTFVLYLPENEIHELGLLYLNYEMTLMGLKTIYLGQATPLEAMEDIIQYFNKIVFISYFTVSPSPDKINEYINNFQHLINSENKHELWILGQQVRHMDSNNIPTGVKTFNTIKATIDALPAIVNKNK
ncbi:MerR family transcriptional regulator [Arenibacter latericius]|uniref:MerR family transcriptional regulator n=1 Tax=Arenibacter latericius TaxID=86104 RepID=UPI00047C5A6F|nr:MerR family transcriptional regulator [Arenibacter latericius]